MEVGEDFEPSYAAAAAAPMPRSSKMPSTTAGAADQAEGDDNVSDLFTALILGLGIDDQTNK